MPAEAPNYEPRRHGPLSGSWDAAEARGVIAAIAEEAYRAFEPQRFWPAHPLEDGIAGGDTTLYFGATGVIWGLDALSRRGLADPQRDFAADLPAVRAANRTAYEEMPYPRHASLLMGDLGVLLLAMRLAPAEDTAEAIAAGVQANDSRSLLELMWGTPGSMRACALMHALTGEERWPALWRHQAERLLAALEPDPEIGAVWTQTLYGERLRYLGAVHGWAGNLGALFQGWGWLEAADRTRLADAAPRTLAATAVQSAAGANWPAVAEAGATAQLVQYCHGAPGIVAVLADAPFATAELDRMLRRGGDLIWTAGPLAKGPGLCHGTAGNGHALLKLYRRLGDPVWLDRARSFAAAAIAQWRNQQHRYGRGRFSLWTGDIGLALYLADCLAGETHFPALEAW